MQPYFVMGGAVTRSLRNAPPEYNSDSELDKKSQFNFNRNDFSHKKNKAKGEGRKNRRLVFTPCVLVHEALHK